MKIGRTQAVLTFLGKIDTEWKQNRNMNDEGRAILVIAAF